MNGAEVVAEILKREGTEFLSCYPRNQIIEPCAALDIRPILCRQERVGVGLADGYSRIKRGKKNGVFAAQAGPGIENAFPGVAQAYAENVPLLIVVRRAAAGAAIRAAGVPRRRRLPAGHQMVGAGAQRAGAARPDAPRLSRHALGQGRPGADRDPRRGVRGRVQGRRSTTCRCRCSASAPDPDAVKKAAQMLLAAKNPLILAGAGRALRRGRRAARGARRADAGAGRHHQSGQERDPRKPSAVARRLDALARRRCSPTSWPRPIWCSRSARASPDAVRAGRAAGQDHHAFHQRRGRHQQGVPRRSRRGGRRRAGARRADRRGLAAEGPGRRQCAARRSRRRSRRPRRPGSTNGRSSSTPTRRRSTSTA